MPRSYLRLTAVQIPIPVTTENITIPATHAATSSLDGPGDEFTGV